MIAVTVSDVKGMMRQLLLREEFDHFLIVEGSITTFLTYSIDGQLQRDFFDGEKEEEIREERWDVRPLGGSEKSLLSDDKREADSPGFRFVFELPRPETGRSFLRRAVFPVRKRTFSACI